MANGNVHALRRDADQSPPGLHLSEMLTLAILETLLERGNVHSYLRTPAGNANAVLPIPAGHETLFVELFATRMYGQLLHRFGTRIASVAERLGLSRGRSCA